MKRSVVVMGTGPGWQEELAAVLKDCPVINVAAVNRAIAEINEPDLITHAVSKHPKEFKDWLQVLKEKGNSKPVMHPIVETTWCKGWAFDSPWMEMSSGLFAVKIMLDLGYDEVYVVGIPLTEEFAQVPLRSSRQKVKDEFQKVIVPDHYWWKKFI